MSIHAFTLNHILTFSLTLSLIYTLTVSFIHSLIHTLTLTFSLILRFLTHNLKYTHTIIPYSRVMEL